MRFDWLYLSKIFEFMLIDFIQTVRSKFWFGSKWIYKMLHIRIGNVATIGSRIENKQISHTRDRNDWIYSNGCLQWCNHLKVYKICKSRFQVKHCVSFQVYSKDKAEKSADEFVKILCEEIQSTSGLRPNGCTSITVSLLNLIQFK